MEKKLLVIVMLSFFASVYVFGQDTIIGWTFPTGKKADSLANLGLTFNKTQAIHLKADSTIKYITATFASPPACAQALGMENGTANEKGWYIKFNTTGYSNILLSSRQAACPIHSGPKYFKIQYKTATGSWTDVPSGNVVITLGWSMGKVNNLSLPSDCDNNSEVNIRWIMTSDSNVAGAMHGTTFVTDSSMSRIDDIVITGSIINSVPNITKESLLIIYPNPASDYTYLSNIGKYKSINIYNSLGICVYYAKCSSNNISLNLTNFNKGIYFVVFESSEGRNVEKLIVK